MKLHLVIAVVICMKAAMASLTFEVSNHGQVVTDAARSGTSTSRNLRSDVSPGFPEKLEAAFINNVGQHFVNNAEYGTIKGSDADLKKVMEMEKGLSKEAKYELFKLDWKDVNLFRNPNFIKWFELHPGDARSIGKQVFDELMETHGDDTLALVKTINAGYMVNNPGIRNLAYRVEGRMMTRWKRELKWSVKQAFEELNLNLIKDESELYGNPAFATWLAYAKLDDSYRWLDNIFLVLSEEENTKDSKSLAAYAELMRLKDITPAAQHWYENIEHTLNYRASWHEIVDKQN